MQHASWSRCSMAVWRWAARQSANTAPAVQHPRKRLQRNAKRQSRAQRPHHGTASAVRFPKPHPQQCNQSQPRKRLAHSVTRGRACPPGHGSRRAMRPLPVTLVLRSPGGGGEQGPYLDWAVFFRDTVRALLEGVQPVRHRPPTPPLTENRGVTHYVRRSTGGSDTEWNSWKACAPRPIASEDPRRARSARNRCPRRHIPSSGHRSYRYVAETTSPSAGAGPPCGWSLVPAPWVAFRASRWRQVGDRSAQQYVAVLEGDARFVIAAERAPAGDAVDVGSTRDVDRGTASPLRRPTSGRR